MTSKIYEAFSEAWSRADDEYDFEPGIQAVLDELLPPPGDNPLAGNLAPHRSSMELKWLRQTLLTVDSAESHVRRSSEAERRRGTSGPGPLGQPDPEAEQILTTLTTVRRALTPWALSGWMSMNAEHDSTEA
jgi:hypothetical protein